MKMIKTEIVKAAGWIITEHGIGLLTTESLATKMGVDRKMLHPFFKKDSDILIFLLLNLKHEIKTLINEAELNKKPPEIELQLLFESMHNFFTQKPFYLTLVLNIEQDKMGNRAQGILISIKTIIGNYLLKIIDKGKEEAIFKTDRTPVTLANNILGSFRSFMNEQNKIEKMVSDLKMIRENPDSL